MDSTAIDHLLSGPLGIRMGLRGEVNDADSIRSGDPKCLVDLLKKAVPILEKRVKKMPESAGHVSVFQEHALRDMDSIRESLEQRPDEFSHLSVFLLWAACANSLNMVHVSLKEHNL